MATGPRDVQSALTLAALAGAAYLLWRSYSAAGDAMAAAGKAADQVIAEVSQAWGNLGSLPPEGDPLKRLLYAGSNYTGLDEAGQPISDAVIVSTPEARQYLYDYGIGAAAQGKPLPVTTSNGAAFGIYPSAGKRRTP